MKTLVIINGPPGAGKTTVSRQLNKMLAHSVWLDGDWCWMINPFAVTEENKRMVEDNITHLLRNFLTNSSIDTVIFSWVIPRESIFAMLLTKLQDLDFKLVKITLLCSGPSLRQRMTAAGRSQEQIAKSIADMTDFAGMDTTKLDTTDLEPAEAAKIIKTYIV